jgi:EAL domain-containing protein (putative c-di-GMP-specific phosphodiesterase class I)
VRDLLLGDVVLDVAFQPIVDLESFAPFGYEVLGRARSGDGTRHHRPDRLLEEAHARGTLLKLDRAWRALAISRIAEAQARRDLCWFFNVDTRCIDDPELTRGFTRAALEASGLGSLRVVIELGERDPLLDAERLARLVPRYAQQGFAIALDDLGAGHASLNRLVELRPDVAKLDMALIRGIDGDPYRLALLKSLVRFAEEVGMHLVAEGIETAAELDAVRRQGVAFGQGYLLGRPRALPPGLASVPPPPARERRAVA